MRDTVSGSTDEATFEHLIDFTRQEGCDCVVMHANGVDRGYHQISLKRRTPDRLRPTDFRDTEGYHVVAIFVFAGPVATTLKPAPRGTRRRPTRGHRARRRVNWTNLGAVTRWRGDV